MIEIVIVDDVTFTLDSTEASLIMSEAFVSTKRRRASHIVPQSTLKRAAFRLIRLATGDGKRLLRLEDWTRNWRGPWIVDLRLSKGPWMGGFTKRSEAIAWEITWLRNSWRG